MAQGVREGGTPQLMEISSEHASRTGFRNQWPIPHPVLSIEGVGEIDARGIGAGQGAWRVQCRARHPCAALDRLTLFVADYSELRVSVRERSIRHARPGDRG